MDHDQFGTAVLCEESSVAASGKHQQGDCSLELMVSADGPASGCELPGK
jgi:hypothetical protein